MARTFIRRAVRRFAPARLGCHQLTQPNSPARWLGAMMDEQILFAAQRAQHADRMVRYPHLDQSPSASDEDIVRPTGAVLGARDADSDVRQCLLHRADEQVGG